MMDLIDKLKYYQENNDRDKWYENQHKVDLCRELDGEFLDPAMSSVVKIETFFSYNNFIPIKTLKNRDHIILPILSKNQYSKKISLSEILIFDMETTGLMGGTGTYPFLLGFGSFEPGGIKIKQYFLPDFGREVPAYLQLVNDKQDKKILLSFNGKTFDYPLLCNRFILNRIDNPFANYEHLDLLHVARRLWKNLLETCSLENIEREIFLFSRWRDLPGALIPQAYFEFLRSGKCHEIKKVILHNQQDIISLGRLLLHLDLLENDPSGDHLNAHELQRLLHLAIKNLDLKNTDILLDLIKRRRIQLPGSILIDLSLLLKRVQQWERAENIWMELLRAGTNVIFASEELAKYYEHRKLDLEQAKLFTERALKHLEVLNELQVMGGDLELQEQFIYRLNRIKRKLME